MDLFARLRAAFAVGDTTDPLGRSLVVEQFGFCESRFQFSTLCCWSIVSV